MPAVRGLISVEEVWTHSNHTATQAKKIAAMLHASEQIKDDAFTAGLLHDIGKLILASRFPKEYTAVIKGATESSKPLWAEEREIFSATHAEVGAYLLSIWGLPNLVIDAVAYHHNPTAITEEGFSALTAVHAANALENLAASHTQ